MIQKININNMDFKNNKEFQYINAQKKVKEIKGFLFTFDSNVFLASIFSIY
jgi:hypothetical protein